MFSITVSGRSAPVVSIDEIVALITVTVPVHVKLVSDQRVQQYLESV